MASDGLVIAPDGVEIRFGRSGRGTPTLIFVHGWGNDRSVWEAQARYFSEGYEVINLDLPGFGESGSNRKEFSIASFGQDIATVIEKLGLEQVVLVGFSMGAAVVVAAASEFQERIVGVVVVDELHEVDATIPPSAIGDMTCFFMDLVAHPSNEKLVGSGFYKKNAERAFERVAAMLEDAPGEGWRESLLSALNWMNDDCTVAISRVQAPVTAINSDLRPTDVEAFRKYAPSFRAKIVPDTGHLLMWDAPDDFNRLLEESIREFQAELERD
jgi:pimeloyl-ACP methyl ester carboxylesterase